jgi:hypothetical protein
LKLEAFPTLHSASVTISSTSFPTDKIEAIAKFRLCHLTNYGEWPGILSC